MSVFATDITHVKNAMLAATENEERIRAFTNALPDVAFIIDEEGRYVEILTSDENLLYKESKALTGKLLHEVLPQNDADKFLEVIRETIDSGKTQVIEYSLDVQKGKIWFEGRTSLVNSIDNNKKIFWEVVNQR